MVKECHNCKATRNVKHVCAVCNHTYCLECCKRYLALKEAPSELVLTCTECFLQHVAWASDRSYDVLGPEQGQPVVLVHGALIGRQCLLHEAQVLASSGFRVLLPDLPAHGARFKEVPLTLENAISVLHDVITKEAPGQKMVIMGFSMGGYVAAAFAAAHPEMMAGVVLAACCHDAHTWTWKMVGKSAELVYSLCSPKTKSGFIYKSYPEVMKPELPVIQECFMRAGAEFDSWKYTWRVMYDANMHDLLPRITCPALLVVGEKDFRSHEAQWLAYLKKGQLLVLQGGIHQFMLQDKIAELYRAEAVAFTRAAEWGKVGDAPDAPAEGEKVAVEGNRVKVVAADVSEQPVTAQAAHSVGLGVVLSNLWKQRKHQT